MAFVAFIAFNHGRALQEHFFMALVTFIAFRAAVFFIACMAFVAFIPFMAASFCGL